MVREGLFCQAQGRFRLLAAGYWLSGVHLVADRMTVNRVTVNRA